MTTPTTTTIPGIAKPVTRIALGTMIVSARERERSFKLLDDAVAAGITTLDTAHGYAGGESERGIGDWMRERKNRDRIVVVTKGCHPNGDRKRCFAHDIASDLRDSLARLKTDHVDGWMLHRDDPEVPIGEIVDELDAHRRAGRIGAYGGSNWTVERLQAANEWAAKHGRAPFALSSPNYSLAEQVQDPWGPGCTTIGGPARAADREWYRATRTAVFAYSSLARGFLSGRITRANYATEKAKLDGACQTAYCHEVNLQRLDRATTLAQEKGVTVPQIATAFILSQGLNVVALIGAENRAEMDAAVAACHLSLSRDELAWLDLAADRRAAASG
jgi:1-deoxyxylulose-5-phosphate synthase